MKTRLFALAILAALLLAGCGGKTFDQQVGEAIIPPTLPAMGEPIPLAVSQQAEITDGSVTLTIENLGEDDGKFQWTCLDEQGKSCAERHSDQADMLFYYEFKLVGATVNDSFMLVSGWEVSK